MARTKDSPYVVRIRIEGARETLRAFNRLGKDANASLRTRALVLSQQLARKIQAAGKADSRQSAAVADTVKARKDRVPFVVIGGTRRVARSGAKAYQLLFGSEFGANQRTGWYAKQKYSQSRGRQFRPHKGQFSYWIDRTVKANEEHIAREWFEAVDEVAREFGGNG